MNILLPASFDPREFAESLHSSDAMTLIKEIDLAQADADFTMQLVAHLIKDVLSWDDEGEYRKELSQILMESK